MKVTFEKKKKQREKKEKLISLGRLLNIIFLERHLLNWYSQLYLTLYDFFFPANFISNKFWIFLFVNQSIVQTNQKHQNNGKQKTLIWNQCKNKRERERESYGSESEKLTKGKETAEEEEEEEGDVVEVDLTLTIAEQQWHRVVFIPCLFFFFCQDCYRSLISYLISYPLNNVM